MLSFVLFILAFAAPKALIVPNKLWFKFGMLLGATLSPVVMFLVYVATIIPTGLILKILGKDPLQQKIDHATLSYWIERTDEAQSMMRLQLALLMILVSCLASLLRSWDLCNFKPMPGACSVLPVMKASEHLC